MELYQNQDSAIKSGLYDNLLAKVFAWMFLGLFSSGLVAYTSFSTGFIEQIIEYKLIYFFVVVELIMVILFSALFKKLSPTMTGLLYFIYSTVNGITLSTIFIAYDISSIIYVFFATAIIFAILSIYGYTTKKDLSNYFTIFLTTLTVSVILSAISLILGNSIFEAIVDAVILLIFGGVTAYDVQAIKKYANSFPEKAHIYGALQLYLDFINIFLRLLSIINGGRSKK